MDFSDSGRASSTEMPSMDSAAAGKQRSDSILTGLELPKLRARFLESIARRAGKGTTSRSATQCLSRLPALLDLFNDELGIVDRVGYDTLPSCSPTVQLLEGPVNQSAIKTFPLRMTVSSEAFTPGRTMGQKAGESGSRREKQAIGSRLTPHHLDTVASSLDVQH